MIAVGKDKKGPGGRKGVSAADQGKRPRTIGKRGMNEQRERAMMPSRLKKKKPAKGMVKKPENTEMKASKRVVRMKETIVLSELAHELGVKVTELIRKLMGLGEMVTANQNVNFETAQVLAAEYEYTVESVAFDEEEHIDTEEQVEMDPAEMSPRPPVVTIMGHVDHGKTSLLDAIRKTNVAAGEAGGITQHIGAYSVEVKGKGRVTFLDTPGHAAFTNMRARGAQVTDVVVLVVAADDGVMPQTVEAIQHAQAAQVPIIVAVNKIDRPNAQPDRVMQELTKYNLLSEAWGGETLFVSTSATKGTGIDELLQSILLQAEVLELKANAKTSAVGVVVEAKLDKGRGPVATVLIQHGVLSRGDSVVVGEFAGRVRAMTDGMGRPVTEAHPSDAVEIIGLEGVPNASDKLNKVDSDAAARDIAQHRVEQRKAAENAGPQRMSLEEMMQRMSGQEGKELKLVIKADVQGSIEAIKGAVANLNTNEVKVSVLSGGVGGIKESDIMLAATSQAIIVGFNVRPDSNARQIAEREGVEIRTYSIIYELLDDVKKAMEGLLKPVAKETIIGRAEVRELFKITKVGTIAGCRVTEGKAQRSARVRVLRDSVQVHDGKLASLKHFKNDVREVDAGSECGCQIEGFADVKQGDVIEFYSVEEVARTLESAGKRSSGPVEAHP
jgi:translation initiation factor IF-2